jgi:DNA repair photolyase
MPGTHARQPTSRAFGPADRRTVAAEQLAFPTAGPSDRRTALPVLDSGTARGASFHEVPVKAILNTPATTGMGFWSLNPYVGCEFGCTYCYARETHKWVMEKAARRPDGSAARSSGESRTGTGRSVPPAGLASESPAAEPPSRRAALPAWLAFEKQILVKTSAAAVLKRTLFPAKLAGASLVIGTATDPYQPAERRFRLTREILEALLGWRGLSLGIITKSPLILRDLPILQRLSERHELSVNISCCSTDAALLRRIEARSPAPHARLRALKRLAAGGINAGLLVAPILPGLTDSRESLAALLAQARTAGARYVAGFPLRVGPATRARLLPHLAREFPELAERYARHFNGRDYASKEYCDALSARFRALQREYGFEEDGAMGGSRRRYRRGARTPRQAGVPEVIEQWTLL